MANTFVRFPQVNGDKDAWAPYLLEQLEGALGTLTGRLYNNAGALTVPKCRIGFDNGLTRGIAHIDTVTAITLPPGVNSTWISIEMFASGSAVVFIAEEIVGATDPTIIPASVRAAWDGEKGGFYLTATKRLIGLAWKSAAGVLLAVVNFDGQKIWASQIGLHTGTIHEQYGPWKGFRFTWSGWNMDTTAFITIAHSLGVFCAAVDSIRAMVTIGGGVSLPINMFTDGADPALVAGGSTGVSLTTISVNRRTGGAFDGPVYTNQSGVVKLTMFDF